DCGGRPYARDHPGRGPALAPTRRTLLSLPAVTRLARRHAPKRAPRMSNHYGNDRMFTMS
ncbi:MAG: hypothetical protein MI723_09275, partial [Caulobacterales bacterium]|nr:hypothetical protein [Caulobacterales bacterium]